MSDLHCCNLNEFLQAMSDETREMVLQLLREREMSVNEITEHLAVTQPTISHHLAVLRRANLVIRRHDGRQAFYRANPACVAECCQEILSRYNPSAAGRIKTTAKL